MNMTTGERIKFYRKRAGMTQQMLSDKIQLSRSYLTDVENGRYNPSVKTLKKIAAALNIMTKNLIDDGHQSNIGNFTAVNFANKNGVKIPVLGRVVAGIPIDAIEDVIDHEEIPAHMAKTGDYFCLKIVGNSMYPQMMEGDIAVIRQQPDVESGEIAVVLVNNCDATIKQIKKSEQGITLIGFNVSEYTPTLYTNQEIENLPITIVGKVVEIRRKL